MAALGAIAQHGYHTRGTAFTLASNFRALVCGHTHMVLGGKEETQGNAAPCLRMDARGEFRFLWVVPASAIDLYVDVKQAINLSPRPRVTVKANSAIGIAANVQSSAASGTGWVSIGPLSVVPTIAGVLTVILENLYDGQFGSTPCYWDNIAETLL